MDSAGQNLWIGIVLGLLLTAVLMFVLYQQSGIADIRATIAAKELAAESVEQRPVLAPVKSVGTESAANVNSAAALETDSASNKVNGSNSAPGNTNADAPAEIGVLGQKSTPSADSALALPEELDLSPAELGALSAAERQQYDELLRSYREIRAQVLQLDQDSAQLRQRMDKMFEQNAALELEIEAMRGELQELPE